MSPALRVDDLARSLLRPIIAGLVAASMVGVLAPAPMRAVNGLSNGEVSPHSGTTATSFTFTVDYNRTQRPDSVTALLDGGNAILLAVISGDENNGTYGATTTLPAGTWTVTFVADAPSNPTTPGPTLTVTTAGASQTPEPTPEPTPPPTSTPTPTPGATATSAPTATARPTSSPTAGATATARQSSEPAPPTPGGGVLGGGHSPSPTPASAAAPGGTPQATPSQSGGVAAGGPSQRTGASPAPNDPDDAPDAVAAERGGIPPAAIMLFVGGAISISGAATLGVLTLRARARASQAGDGGRS